MRIKYMDKGVGQSVNGVWFKDRLFKKISGDLLFDGHSVTELYGKRAEPLYVYSERRIRENIDALTGALVSAEVPFSIHYAMKANRNPDFLQVIRRHGAVGIDACSPDEVNLALQFGFSPEEISVTASNLSDHDLRRIAATGVHLNSDSVSVFRRFGAFARSNQTVGIRLDPPVPLVREGGEKLNYVGSKFGVSVDDFLRVKTGIAAAGLNLDTLHFHCGWAMQASHANAFEKAVEKAAELAAADKNIRFVNVGGGLCRPHHAADNPLALADWTAAIRKHLSPLGVHVRCEIGTFIAANAGILVMEVNTVELRRQKWWLGVNSGHAVNVYAYHYGIPQEIISVNSEINEPTVSYSIGSNINEAGDLIAGNIRLPEISEGDLLAVYATGAYGAAMASNHCMRGGFRERMLSESLI